MTDTCVSLTTGTTGPDQRVNYAYGMVLGVDEFLTEQQHRLEHAYRHERALHGFGTVYGLEVTAETSADDPNDVTVTVSTGLLIDQAGREALITCAQCARIGAWLAAREQAAPGTVAGHRDPSGGLTVYVVAKYATCLDNLVPLPGTPCSTSSQTSVASRIRDAWDVELTFDLPPMPRWDTDRRLARLLAAVHLVPGLPEADSAEQQLLDAVLGLSDRVGDGPGDLDPDSSPSGPVFRLPAETAADALDRIFTAWVTRVRPQLEPDLSTPGEPAPILLATIAFSAAEPFDPLHPVITAFDPPDDTGRPYLLHTGLLQELRSLDADLVTKPRELVTLAAAVDANGHLSLDAWFHLTDPVTLPGIVAVETEGGGSAGFTATAVGGIAPAPRWLISAPDDFVPLDGEQLVVHFDGATTLIGALRIGAPATTLADVQAAGLTLLNSDPDGSVAAYATIEIDPAPPPPPPPPVASAEFVMITTGVLAEKKLGLELWFHPQPRGPRDDTRLADKPVFEIFDEITGNPVNVTALTPNQLYANVWNVETDVPDNKSPLPAYLRLVFRTKEMTVQNQLQKKINLATWIDKNGILFVGWDRRELQIIAFARVAPGAKQ
ncbi:hypothetical protein [Micromonospora sp. NPDC005806]|uniref:hypothetical protein n=1 Tax=Micromonospora sp. NPDC005806 TaxID=3364234 RepID=UPI0036A7ABA3